VAYRTQINKRERTGAVAAVVAIHAALLFVFLHMSGKLELADPQSVLRIFNISPPTPPLPPLGQRQQPKPKEKQGGSAPKNLKSQATPLAAPKPQIVTPPVQQVAASETARQGTASTQGASNVAGPGTGAGGVGTGAGSGTGGTGTGGGGEGAAYPPQLATPVLSGSDFPGELLDQWPPGTTVFLRLRIDARGFVSECLVDRGTGVPAIDSTLCNLVYTRLRFRPALSRSGQAVAGWFGYAQRAPR
jgi:periplasmic protein TonB